MQDDSKCPRNKYCDFEVVLSNQEAQVEICRFCGKKVIYNKDKETGRIDNQKYLRDHIRHTAQPFGSTRKIFEEIYGKLTPEQIKRITQRQQSTRSRYPKKYIKRAGFINPKTKQIL